MWPLRYRHNAKRRPAQMNFGLAATELRCLLG